MEVGVKYLCALHTLSKNQASDLENIDECLTQSLE